ncbi:uncharacterized protein ARMOST_10365 [Armillaria ostoyae]|uniref:Uncharacterized protein n=1 Tax=Armillaria ostoyae TaxID=47428 RepID=A0A284RE34_ARMOS|nr:uncharacterized protein ARMOST_10365 [Armillaria ostoyae]
MYVPQHMQQNRTQALVARPARRAYIPCPQKPLPLPFAYNVSHLIAQFRVALHVFYPSRRAFFPTIHPTVHVLPSVKHRCASMGSTDGESVERAWALVKAPETANTSFQRVLYKARL